MRIPAVAVDEAVSVQPDSTILPSCSAVSTRSDLEILSRGGCFLHDAEEPKSWTEA